MIDFKGMANKIWCVADLLRGDYKQSDYGKIILPMTVLRRLDCILAPTKQAVLDYLPKIEKLSDILFVIAGATIGKVAILTEKFCPSNTNQAVSFIRLADKDNVKFVWYWLQSNSINKVLWLDAVQSAQPNLSMENLGNFYVPFLPVFEQTTIVAHIETECSRLDTIINKFKKQIELFKEYRTTLISEVVTGKIDVRGEVAV